MGVCVIRIYYKYIFLLCFINFIPNQTLAANFNAVKLEAGINGPELNQYVYYIKNYSGLISNDTLIDNFDQFQKVETPTINFGIPDGKILVVLKVENSGIDEGSWILTTGRGSLKFFQMFEVTEQSTELLIDGTDLEQVQENLNNYQAFSTELSIAPGQQKLFAFIFEPENSSFFPLQIDTFSSFFKARRANIAMVSGVVLGILMLTFINAIVFLVTAKKEFMWLLLADISFILMTLHTEGYTTIYWLYDMPLLSLSIGDIFKCLFAITMAQFARSFIDTKRHFPKMNIALLSIIIFGLSVIILEAGVPIYSESIKQLLHASGWLVTASVALFLPFVGIYATRSLGMQYFPLVISWSSLALYILYAGFVTTGIVEGLPFNWHWVAPVGLFEAFFASLALGLHLRKILKDRVVAEQNLSKSLQEQLTLNLYPVRPSWTN